MASFEIRHTFSVDADDFWPKIFFNEAFNQTLYAEGLGFAAFEYLERGEQPNGVRSQKVRAEPKSEMPAAVQKIIGDSVSYVESGSWDSSTKHYHFQIEPAKMADKIEIEGEMWCEPSGEGKCERVIRTDVKVRIFGVGKMMEGFIEKTTRENYDKAGAFTEKWIREQGL